MTELNQNAPPARAPRQGLRKGTDAPKETTVQKRLDLTRRAKEPSRIIQLPWREKPKEKKWRQTCEELKGLKELPLLTLDIPWECYLHGITLRSKERWTLDLIVYLVIHAQHYNRRKGMKGYARLAYGYIRDIAGEPGLRALGWLREMGVIKRDEYYVRGKKAYGFRLTKTALSWGYSVKTMPSLYAKKMCPPSRKRDLGERDDRATYAQQLRTLQTVTVDPEIWTVLATPSRGVSRRKTVSQVLAASHIRNRNWFFSVHEETGRCFNNVTSFRSALRKYLRVGGKATVELDIACSQPTLLMALAYKERGTPEEREFALSLVQSGTFYRTLCEWAGDGDLPHEEQKSFVFKSIVYSKKADALDRFPQVRVNLPTMGAYIDEAKREAPNALALRLQKLEAVIMLGRVMPTLAAMGVGALSIHDGCLVAAEHGATAQAVIEAEFMAETGIAPTVRIKAG